MFKIAVLVSGGGTDLQSIIDAIEAKYLDVQIELVIGSKAGIYALERAAKNHLKTCVIDGKSADFSDCVLALTQDKVDLIKCKPHTRDFSHELSEQTSQHI